MGARRTDSNLKATTDIDTAHQQLKLLCMSHRKGVPWQQVADRETVDAMVANGLAYWRNPRIPNRLLYIPPTPPVINDGPDQGELWTTQTV